MKKKWEPKLIGIGPKIIQATQYEGLIAEVAEILYDLFCQLDRPIKAEPIETSVSPGDLTLRHRRTGTHG